MKQIQTRHKRWMADECMPGLVSVIVPTYNRSHLLPEALDSVFKQTYRPIELLIVDDGSTDGTKEFLESWRLTCEADNDFSIRYFYQENAGAPTARNLGLIESAGEYIQFLDSDDVLYPDMLQRVVDVFEREHCDFVHVGYEKLCAECHSTFYQYVPDSIDDPLISYMSGRFYGNSLSLTRRRTLCRDIGPWDESLPIDQDGDYMCRTILHTTNMKVVQDTLFAYMVRSGLKVTDGKGSRRAWQARLQRETQFCLGISGRKRISKEDLGVYAGRLYEIAVNLSGGGDSDIGQGFAHLANNLSGPLLDKRGKRMRGIFKSGHLTCKVFMWIKRLKKQFLSYSYVNQKLVASCPQCGR